MDAVLQHHRTAISPCFRLVVILDYSCIPVPKLLIIHSSPELIPVPQKVSPALPPPALVEPVKVRRDIARGLCLLWLHSSGKERLLVVLRFLAFDRGGYPRKSGQLVQPLSL